MNLSNLITPIGFVWKHVDTTPQCWPCIWYNIKKLMIIQWIYSPVIKRGNWTSTIYLDWLISHDLQPPCLVRAFSSQPCLITRRYPHNTIWNPMKFHYIPIVVGEISLNPMKSIWLNCLNLTTPPKKIQSLFLMVKSHGIPIVSPLISADFPMALARSAVFLRTGREPHPNVLTARWARWELA